jgi:hypothetical protein
MGDKYDEAVAYLTEHPDSIFDSWKACGSMPGGCLFQFATPTGSIEWRRDDGEEKECGCLTTIRCNPGERHAWSDELTVAILGDQRIPLDARQIDTEHLPVFAEWQRRLDREIRRDV